MSAHLLNFDRLWSKEGSMLIPVMLQMLFGYRPIESVPHPYSCIERYILVDNYPG